MPRYDGYSYCLTHMADNLFKFAIIREIWLVMFYLRKIFHEAAYMKEISYWLHNCLHILRKVSESMINETIAEVQRRNQVEKKAAFSLRKKSPAPLIGRSRGFDQYADQDPDIRGWTQWTMTSCLF